MDLLGVPRLLALLFLVGVGVWAWRSSSKPPPAGQKGPVGFGGWLLLLVVAQSLAAACRYH